MKKTFLLLLLTSIIWSCGKEDDFIPDTSPEKLIPERFTVDIPNTLSNPNGLTAGRLGQQAPISGDAIYGALRRFIFVGESAANVLESIIVVVRLAQAANIDTFTIPSEDDGRSKTFTFSDNVTYGGESFARQMIVTDEGGQKALQVVWNTSPVQGVAILNPYYLNRTEDQALINTFYRLDYSESSDAATQTMTVTIDGVPSQEGLDKLKMTVVKKGNVFEVFGNSNHPKLELISADLAKDRNYAFVARADESSHVAVAAVALPPSTVTTADVMESYSVYSVLEAEIKSLGITDEVKIQEYLVNTQPPAYFDNTTGFLGAGATVPDNAGFSSSFIDLSALSPYVPKEVADLSVGFLQ